MKVKDFLNLKAVRIPNEDANMMLEDDVLVFIFSYANIGDPSSYTMQTLGDWKKSNAPVLEDDVVGYDVSDEGLVTLLL